MCASYWYGIFARGTQVCTCLMVALPSALFGPGSLTTLRLICINVINNRNEAGRPGGLVVTFECYSWSSNLT